MHCPTNLSIEEIYKFYLKSLTRVPLITGLVELDCSFCPSLTSIPMIDDLEELNCWAVHY